MLKGGYDPLIQQKRYARFYFGLNVIGQEAVTPENLHSFPIPFKRTDIMWARFKQFKTGPNYAGYKIRCDQEVERFERKKLELTGKPDSAQVLLIDTYLRLLKYIKEGPYDSSRN